MSLISKPYTFTTGATIIASEHNSNFDTLYNDYNGNIVDANIAPNALISDTKLNQIQTVNKVAGTALTTFASISSAAGLIPLANIPLIPLVTGTTGQLLGSQVATANSANSIVVLNGSTQLPAVDGSLVYNLFTSTYGSTSGTSATITAGKTVVVLASGIAGIYSTAHNTIVSLNQDGSPVIQYTLIVGYLVSGPTAVGYSFIYSATGLSGSHTYTVSDNYYGGSDPYLTGNVLILQL